MSNEKFKKFDEGKLEYSMLPNSIVEDIIKVMMFGARKYGADNWKTCKDTTRYYNAGRRHEEAHRAGEYLDPESGYPHTVHALVNYAFLHYLEKEKYESNKNGRVDPSENSGVCTRTQITLGNGCDRTIPLRF